MGRIENEANSETLSVAAEAFKEAGLRDLTAREFCDVLNQQIKLAEQVIHNAHVITRVLEEFRMNKGLTIRGEGERTAQFRSLSDFSDSD